MSTPPLKAQPEATPPLKAQPPAITEARLFAVMLAMRTRSRLDFQRFMLRVLTPVEVE